MLSTKKIVINESSVPSYWVFKYYLNLSEELTGQDVKIKSIFNPSEKTPSFCIFVDKTKMQYMYKDFSTGKYGGKINLIQELFNVPYNIAIDKMIDDYNNYLKTNTVDSTAKMVVQPKWKLDFIKNRGWDKKDSDFWTPFNIGSALLDEYNVKPIEYYSLTKEIDGKTETFKVRSILTYGYYDSTNDVSKIYSPYSKKQKFYNVKPYIQGLDQLKYSTDYLVICSSLKDAMCLRSFGYKLEVIAPNSENTMIKPYVIENLKSKYKKIITLFDNDEAGKKAIDAYTEVYNINGFCLSICKDLSDAVKEKGIDVVHSELGPKLKQTLNK